jgi:hypothetical protein
MMKKQLITKTRMVQQAVLAGNAECKVLYNSAKDIVELEVGGTSLRIAATSFMMINEMMRKAAAKLVMQTELKGAIQHSEQVIKVETFAPRNSATHHSLQALQLV